MKRAVREAASKLENNNLMAQPDSVYTNGQRSWDSESSGMACRPSHQTQLVKQCGNSIRMLVAPPSYSYAPLFRAEDPFCSAVWLALVCQPGAGLLWYRDSGYFSYCGHRSIDTCHLRGTHCSLSVYRGSYYLVGDGYIKSLLHGGEA